MKKRFCSIWFILVFVFLITLATPVLAAKNKQLSAASDEEILQFLNDYELTPPEGGLQKEERLLSFVRQHIQIVEENPAYVFAYGHPPLQQFANDLRAAVNDYYGISEPSVIAMLAEMSVSARATAYTLKDSTYYNLPDNASQFNCYAYVLGITDNECMPGQFCDNLFLNYETAEIGDLVDSVVGDLQSDDLGYSCIKATYTRPTASTLVDGQIAFCGRFGESDYHFMRLYGSSWRHKVGTTAVLTYNYSPQNSLYWTNERHTGQYAVEGNTTYDSTIAYFLVAENHTYSTAYTGYNYHSGLKHYYQYTKTCQGCGTVTTYYNVQVCNGNCNTTASVLFFVEQ